MRFTQSSKKVVLIYLWSLPFSCNHTFLTWAILFGSLGPGHASLSHSYWFLVSGNLRLTPRRTLYSFLFCCCHCFFFFLIFSFFLFLFSFLRQSHWPITHYVADSGWNFTGICLVSFQSSLSSLKCTTMWDHHGLFSWAMLINDQAQGLRHAN